jgi:hypothetical protein
VIATHLFYVFLQFLKEVEFLGIWILVYHVYILSSTSPEASRGDNTILRGGGFPSIERKQRSPPLRSGFRDLQHQFPKLRAVFHQLMSFARFCKRQHAIDDRANLSRLNELHRGE